MEKVELKWTETDGGEDEAIFSTEIEAVKFAKNLKANGCTDIHLCDSNGCSYQRLDEVI